jgi:hypothetical protein
MKLNKLKISELSKLSMTDVHGGGQCRSERLNGGCNYSDNHPVQNDCGNTVGCHAGPKGFIG